MAFCGEVVTRVATFGIHTLSPICPPTPTCNHCDDTTDHLCNRLFFVMIFADISGRKHVVIFRWNKENVILILTDSNTAHTLPKCWRFRIPVWSFLPPSQLFLPPSQLFFLLPNYSFPLPDYMRPDLSRFKYPGKTL